MNDQAYRDAVCRTESVVDQSTTMPVDGVVEILATIEQLSNILDTYKKSVFYGADVVPQDNMRRVANTQSSLAEVTNLVRQSMEGRSPVQSTNVDMRLVHALMGMVTETGELAGALLQALTLNKVTDDIRTNILEEMGDYNWYQAIALDTLGVDFASLRNANIAKLKQRYGDKFSKDSAINRDTNTEMDALKREVN